MQPQVEAGWPQIFFPDTLLDMARNQNPGALMNIEIGSKWTFIPPTYMVQ